MASVTSLDKDLRKLRMDKYTPTAANEARLWIEEMLGEQFPSADLLEGLKDGVALCRLINLAVPPPGVKFKKSAMPFVQMENISHFLRACQQPPLNLHQHDTFLTVDLYEQKDPTQVLQCLGAFSRAAREVNPDAFPTTIGPRSRSSVLSPQSTGPPPSPLRGRGLSSASNGSTNTSQGTLAGRTPLLPSKTGDSGSGRWSPTRSATKSPASPGVSVSSWSRKEHEGSTLPAWNIAQYGYMGGASQGKLGISFGGRRQITGASPSVPSPAEKEKRRKEREAEEERQRQEIFESRKGEKEEQARLEEERRREEASSELREAERHKVQEERRRWEEEEQMWQKTEEKRRREEEEAEAHLAEERRRAKTDAKLRGQYLSQYQAEQGITPPQRPGTGDYSGRIKELEKELEKARQREAEYERERAGRLGKGKPVDGRARARSRSRPRPPGRHDSWSRDQREILHTPRGSPNLSKSPRPLPDPALAASPFKVQAHHTGSSRPLPDPAAYAASAAASPARHSKFDAVNTPTVSNTPIVSNTPMVNTPAANVLPTMDTPNVDTPTVNTLPTANMLPIVDTPPSLTKPTPPPPDLPPRSAVVAATPTSQPVAPPPPKPSPKPLIFSGQTAPRAQTPVHPTYAREVDATSERDAEDRRRVESQAKTKAGGLASKSLLEREMEMERQRQREWEEAQLETARRAAMGDGDGQADGLGGRWDVNQWSGYTGGDGQNKGSQGIGATRRQIVGPRPLPGPPGH